VDDALRKLPAEVLEHLEEITSYGGMLSADLCQQICGQLSSELEALMVQLLPLAASFSNPVISKYQVGAVAKGVTNENGFANLYLGANFEFANQALCFSIHAEQSALSNAWCHDEPYLESIAVTAPPCGHCRQFLYEMSGDRDFRVVLPSDKESTKVDIIDLSQLLPSAFGPLDLGCERLLMEPGFGSNQFSLSSKITDELVANALHATRFCYAPYTSNFAGCAIELDNGKMYIGRYAENAAHNPSLSPFASAYSNAMLSRNPTENIQIKRVVLIENPTLASQKNVCEIQLSGTDSDAKLEYICTSTN